MSLALRKRKRGAPKEAAPGGSDEADLQALLQRHFEARFKPLATAPVRRASDSDEDDEDEDDETVSDPSGFGSDSEWDGISDAEDDEESAKVEVVDHTAKTSTTSTMSKKQQKEYLSSKPPSQTTTSKDQTANRKPSGDEDTPEDSAAFLANDLALQRLIAESHILSAAGGNASHYLSSAAAATATNTRAFAEGRTRLKTTDMRIQALGARESVLAQAKMPMSMRKGMVRAASTREEKRRREARENGIVLERQAAGAPKKGKTNKRFERRVDMPSVGKMRGAELKISAREIRAIEAEGKRRGVDRGRRRRRR